MSNLDHTEIRKAGHDGIKVISDTAYIFGFIHS